MKKEELYDGLIKKFGATNQVIMTFEEMAEVQKELTKAYRGNRNLNHIAEELADLEIMIEQMKRYFGVEKGVKEWKDKKLLRIEAILKGEI